MDHLHTFCKQHNLIVYGDKVIVGLSGGPDSVFLLHFLQSIKDIYNLELIAAHLDHGWRSNSHEDVMWCKRLCDSLNIKFISVHANNVQLTKQPNGSLEEHGRLLRRAFFQDCLQRFNAHKIALGHHHDDQLETFFIRLLRGAGTTGLQGIKPQDSYYIRPLLAIPKQDILEYLNNNNISYLIDPTNSSDNFLRNRIRNYIIPAVHATDARSLSAIKRSFANLQETEKFLEQLTQQTFEQISRQQNDSIFINQEKFLALEPFLQKRVLLVWLCSANVPFVPTQQFFDEILRFITTSQKNKHQVNKQWWLQRAQGNQLFIVTC